MSRGVAPKFRGGPAISEGAAQTIRKEDFGHFPRSEKWESIPPPLPPSLSPRFLPYLCGRRALAFTIKFPVCKARTYLFFFFFFFFVFFVFVFFFFFFYFSPPPELLYLDQRKRGKGYGK